MDIKKIAIIGSGISGLSSAYLLYKDYQLTLYEQQPRVGGHSRTIVINPNSSVEISVDTGFIVLNDKTYPYLNGLFKQLGVDLVKTEMSFAVSSNDGELEWSGSSLGTLFAQRKNIFNPRMLQGLLDILKFNHKAVAYVKSNPNLTLKELLDKMKLGKWFLEYYIIPMGGAIWSCSFSQMLNFPATSFVNFFKNHGLLNIYNRPQWYTLKDKSISYVQAIIDIIQPKAKIFTDAKIDAITRENQQVKVNFLDKSPEYFDEVIFACHPVEILKILKDPSNQEANALNKFSRQTNLAYTHSDSQQMPKLLKCWSSWNYLYLHRNQASRVAVTYWMNKLQHIDNKFPVFVTLNPIKSIVETHIYDVHTFYHPVFDQNAMVGQDMIFKLQGQNRLWFCGAYLRNGFHEDGIWSAYQVQAKLINSF